MSGPTEDMNTTAETVARMGAPYKQMLDELRDEHGDDIDAHLHDLVRDAIHESYKELDSQ
jgi:hypothetical protein